VQAEAKLQILFSQNILSGTVTVLCVVFTDGSYQCRQTSEIKVIVTATMQNNMILRYPFNFVTCV
jgi:hypothetical protein